MIYYYIIGVNDVDVSSPMNYGTPSSLGSLRTPRSGIRSTPRAMRPDIGNNERRIRQINLPTSEVNLNSFFSLTTGKYFSWIYE